MVCQPPDKVSQPSARFQLGMRFGRSSAVPVSTLLVTIHGIKAESTPTSANSRIFQPLPLVEPSPEPQLKPNRVKQPITKAVGRSAERTSKSQPVQNPKAAAQ